MPSLCYTAKFDLFISLNCAPALNPGAIQGKEGIKFCHLATLQRKDKTRSEARVACFPAALYPKRNKVKASEDDGDEGTINIIAAATFPIKPQRSLYFTPVKMSGATDGRTDLVPPNVVHALRVCQRELLRFCGNRGKS